MDINDIRKSEGAAVLKTSDFYFDLPEELIAQDPLEDRSSSRLLLMDKNTGEIKHKIFKDIIVGGGFGMAEWFTNILKDSMQGVKRLKEWS